MAQKKRLPKAEYIILDQVNTVVLIVYTIGTNLADLRGVAKRLENQTGLLTQVLRTRIIHGAGTRPLIAVKTDDIENFESAMLQLKEIVKPKLPVAIGKLEIELLLCTCQYISTRQPVPLFVEGFLPEDAESFMLNYYAAMQQLPVVDLLRQAPQPPYGKLRAGIVSMMSGLGASVSALELWTSPDTRPCTHP